MRTLKKFRAWTGNEMRYDIVGFNWDESFGVCNAWLGNNIEYNADNFLINVLLLQYTGIKDKNGVEIYEGDILKDEQTERFWKINFRNHAHGLYFESYYPTFDNAFMRDFNSNKWAGRYWEVIGNIYENPELLEGLEE